MTKIMHILEKLKPFCPKDEEVFEKAQGESEKGSKTEAEPFSDLLVKRNAATSY